MVDWAGVRTWRGKSLDPTLDDLIAERKKTVELGDIVQTVDSGIEWQGAGATQASASLDKMESQVATSLANLGKLITATSEAQNGMGEVETLALEATSRAQHFGFVIAENGSKVTDPVGIPHNAPSEEIEFRVNMCRKCADSVSRAIAKAAEVDAAYVKALADVAEGRVETKEGLNDTTPGLPDVLPPDTSTEQVASWWNSLTRKEQETLVRKFPRQIGKLNGVQGWARDRANRNCLEEDLRENDEHIEDLKQRLKKLHRPSIKLIEEHKKALIKQEELRKLKNALGISEKPPTQLLLYDPPTGEKGHEKLHAAMSVGDVDSAEHVSTYVPGMGTTIHGTMGALAQNMKDLSEITGQEVGGQDKVATIAWIGYDTPNRDLSVTNLDRARAGAENLRGFLEGLRDSRDASTAGTAPLHQTVLGHSYGSTTSSLALSSIRPGVVDGFAMFGSPGYQGDGKWDFNVPQDRIYAMRYHDDIVKHGVDTGIWGKNPMSDTEIKKLDPGKSDDNKLSHTSYMDRDPSGRNKSLENLSKVVVGQAG